jgi:site-specific DNA-cytosine methylase
MRGLTAQAAGFALYSFVMQDAKQRKQIGNSAAPPQIRSAGGPPLFLLNKT